jgi:hypothetical protein
MRATAVYPGLVLLLGLWGITELHAEAAANQLQLDGQQQIVQLTAHNQQLAQQLQTLEQRISGQFKSPMPEKLALEQAQANQDLAAAAQLKTPSTANQQQVEETRFAYLIAERKYQRANRGLAKLQQEQQSISEHIALNSHRIAQSGKIIEEQLNAQQQIQTTEQAQQEEQAKQQRQAEKRAQRKQERALIDAREEHAAALAEIKRLKEQLALSPKYSPNKSPNKSTNKNKNKNKPPKPATSVANQPKNLPIKPKKEPADATHSKATNRAVAKRTQNKTSTPYLKRAQWVRGGGRARYHALLKSAREDGTRSRVDSKLLQVQTYKGKQLLKQTSHSLKYLGNSLYQAKTVVRAGSTEFVVDGKRWSQRIPQSINKDQFVFLLDARNASQPELLLFAKNEVE